jgi:hypothetical protein
VTPDPVNPAFDAKLRQRDADRQPDDAGHGRAGASRERPCVLVVDDEPEITTSVAELLGRD